MTNSKEKIQMYTKDIEKMEREIFQLQHIKCRLMSRNKQLLDETRNTEMKTLIEEMDIDTKKFYDKVFPFVSEIHNLELRSQELKEKIQLANMENEANMLLLALTGKSHITNDVLSRWFHELDKMSTAGSPVTNLKQKTWMLKSGAKKEKLQFTVLHGGICLMVQIFIIEQLQQQNISSDVSLESVEVFSDIFIPDLLQTVKNNMSKKNSVSKVVQYITEYIMHDIIPYIAGEQFKQQNEMEESSVT